MKFFSINIIVIIFSLCTSAVAGEKVESFKPSNGFVPNEETAIRIALAIWEPIYGKELIASEKPYKATLENGIWLVKGSLPINTAGGTAIAEISKENGQILRVIHEK